MSEVKYDSKGEAHEDLKVLKEFLERIMKKLLKSKL